MVRGQERFQNKEMPTGEDGMKRWR